MTGPDHYLAAEKLIESSAVAVNESDDAALILPAAAQWALTAAQVHATLALAAATALHGADPAGIAWLEVTS